MWLNNKKISVPDSRSAAFLADAADLFSKRRQGHMERWEYASPRYKNDPASGADAWAKLIRNPGHYYPPQGDIDTIRHALGTDVSLQKKLCGIEYIVELGPGCKKSLTQKTLPVIQQSKAAKNYLAVDATIDLALDAARIIQKKSDISCSGQAFDFFEEAFRPAHSGRSLVLFWGSTLGNFDGAAGHDPFSKLVPFLQNIRLGLKPGDAILFSFDSEKDERRIIAAYSEPMMSAQILSIIHQTAQHASGDFDPHVWKHRPIWIEETMQCGHIIYPIVDQHFFLGGQEFLIKAYEPILSNNSYKYSPERITAAALMAGYTNPSIIQKGAMALLSADC